MKITYAQLYLDYLTRYPFIEIPYYELYDKVRFTDSGNALDFWSYTISDDLAIEQIKQRINLLNKIDCKTPEQCNELCLLHQYIKDSTINYTRLKCFSNEANRKKREVIKCIKRHLLKHPQTTLNNHPITIKNLYFGKNSLKFWYQ